MTDGREFRANTVVSDAGMRTTMDRLLGSAVPKALPALMLQPVPLPSANVSWMRAGALSVAGSWK